MRRWLPIVLFAALGVLLAYGLTRSDPEALPSQMIDRPVPEFSLPQLHAPALTVTQDDLRGEVALLNVFGSWCVACVVEHPVLMEAGEEVRLVGVNWRDTRPKAKAWLARYEDPYDLIVFDENSRLAIELGVSGAPETFVVDAQGRIRYKHTGPISEDDWARTLRPLVQRLRAEGAA